MKSLSLAFSLVVLTILISVAQGNNGTVSTVPRWGEVKVNRTSATLRWVTVLERGEDEVRIGSLDIDIELGRKKASASLEYVEVSANTTDNRLADIKYVSDSATLTFNRQKGSVSFSSVTVDFNPIVLVEYLETDGVEGFNPETDEFLSSNDLAQVVWKPLNLTKTTSHPSGATVYIVVGEAVSGVFGFRYVIADSDLNIEGNQVGSESAKIDLWIKYFDPITNPNGYSLRPGSRVALIATLSTTTKRTDIDYQFHGRLGNMNGVSVSSNGTRVGFSWSLDAQTNNGFIRVVSQLTESYNFTLGGKTWRITVSNSSTTQVLIYSFLDVRPSFIYWDPTIGTQTFAPEVAPVFINSEPASSNQPTSVSETETPVTVTVVDSPVIAKSGSSFLAASIFLIISSLLIFI